MIIKKYILFLTLIFIILIPGGISAANSVDTISSGNLSATSDGSRIFVSPNTSVTAQSFVLKNNCTLVIGDFATVTIPNGIQATTGANCKIILGSGSALQIDTNASLTLGTGSLLDCKNGSLNLSEDTTSTLFLSKDCTLSLGNFPVTGNGTIAAPPCVNNAHNQRYAFLDAPCSFIFNGVSVTGMWNIDRAYPQWFAQPGCEDWSAPINKAIAMKRTGEVFLKSGLYPVAHSIRVTYGIELIGESGYRRYNEKNALQDPHGTLIYASNNSSSKGSSLKRFEAQSLVLVNIIQNRDSLLNKLDMAGGKHWLTRGMWEKPYPVSTTAIRNITFKNGVDYEQKSFIVGLNGIYVAGGIILDRVRFLDFKQGLVRSRDYADNFIVQNCLFSALNKVHYMPDSTNPKDTATVEDNVKTNGAYMVRLDGDGDNLQFVENVINGDFLLDRALFIGQCRGGIVSDNIMHGDVELQGCRALTFSNNHMESPKTGRMVRVLNSQVDISNNFFYKSERGNILLSANGYGEPTVAEIHNNTYYCTYHELDAVDQADLRKEFNRIREIWIARSSAPEIIVGYGATANITNQYRQVALKNSQTWPLTVGIQFGTEMINGTPMSNDNPRALLNNLSPYLSCSGRINAGFSINGINHQQLDINKRIASMMPNSHDRWYAPSGEYEYYAVFVIDRQRNIIAYPDGKAYIQLKYSGASSLSKDNFIDNPSSADAVSTLIPIQDGSYSPPWSGYLRMFRCRVISKNNENNEKKERIDWKTVDVPVVNSFILYDNGLFLSGYPWQECANPLDSLNNATDTLKIQDVTHTNESVECTAITKPTSLPDAWNRGDKIYNVGNQTDWTIFIKK